MSGGGRRRREEEESGEIRVRTVPSANPRELPATVSTSPVATATFRTRLFHVSATYTNTPSGDTATPAG